METDTANDTFTKDFQKCLLQYFKLKKKSLRSLHTICFSKLYYVQKSQTKALFKYFSKYTFLQSNMSLNCLLVMAQRRLPEYIGPFVVNCFTMYIHEKCYRLGTFSTWNVTWKKCHQSWHWCGVGKKSMYVWLGSVCKCSVCNLKTQGRTVWTNTAGVIRLSSALHTHNITLFFSKHCKTVQYLAEADAPPVSSNSHTAPLTHNLGNK